MPFSDWIADSEIRSSIYCIEWHRSGEYFATGSNDKVVHVVRLDAASWNTTAEINIDCKVQGTIRDLAYASTFDPYLWFDDAA